MNGRNDGLGSDKTALKGGLLSKLPLTDIKL